MTLLPITLSHVLFASILLTFIMRQLSCLVGITGKFPTIRRLSLLIIVRLER